eukprot:13168665-Heterocapsa_arctica.AAC.1
MTGKGRYHEGQAADPGNWLDGLSVRRTEMCHSVIHNTTCDHYRSARGCGFAHSKGEIREAEIARTLFVREALLSHGWPWY